jgi:L,D-transpeptidase ErfK/SrfK
MKKVLFMIAIVIFIFQLRPASSEVLFHRNGDTVLGEAITYEVKSGESLVEIARKFDLGYNEIVDANPSLDPFVPGSGASVKIPTAWILPDTGFDKGIVINLAELRLYYFYRVAGRMFIRTHPIGVGSEGHDTPVGEYRIIEKIEHPSWHVPESIKREKPYLPDVVPPGADNPLGSHAMRLSLPTILIHGTDKPWGLGRLVSHGCIRLYPEDVPTLFMSVAIGTRVSIVRQPVKAGTKDGRVYVEVHRDASAPNGDYFQKAVQLLRQKDLIDRVDTKKLYSAVEEMKGMPVDISN